MKGLLLKDWYQVKTNMRMMYLTVLAVLAIWILSTSGDSSFAVNYSVVFLGMMPAYLLSYDHASGWTEYSFALPLSKELQVAEKYLVGLLCTAVSAALNGISAAFGSGWENRFLRCRSAFCWGRAQLPSC